jgi:hypothetical protein
MPIAPSKVHIGPGDVWVTSDLTAVPAAGGDLSDPTSSSLMAMASGFTQPTTAANPSWRYVGATQNVATLTYRPTFYMVESEQAFAPIITTPTAEEATVAFTMLEADYRNLALGMSQATTEVNAGAPVNNAIFVGGKTTVTQNVVVLCSRKRSGTGYFLLTVYQAYSAEGVALPFARREEMRIAATLNALADATRPVGDQLFQLVDYAANPS